MLLAVACNGDASAPDAPAGETPTGPESPPIDASPTPTVTPAGEPTSRPTPERPVEPVTSTASIPTEDLPLVRFLAPNGAEALLPVEVPPRDEFHIGLSGRYTLEGRGMLFYFAGGGNTGGFWMRNTHIDLDIAFVDRDLEVIAVMQMEANTEEIHSPGSPYLAAIEAPAGWYADHGIDAGAAVEFLFEIPEHLR